MKFRASLPSEGETQAPGPLHTIVPHPAAPSRALHSLHAFSALLPLLLAQPRWTAGASSTACTSTRIKLHLLCQKLSERLIPSRGSARHTTTFQHAVARRVTNRRRWPVGVLGSGYPADNCFGNAYRGGRQQKRASAGYDYLSGANLVRGQAFLTLLGR